MKTKGLKPMFKELTACFGGDERTAGLFIALILDLFKEFTKDGDREMRTLKIELNGFFSITYDFTNDKVIEKTTWEEHE